MQSSYVLSPLSALDYSLSFRPSSAALLCATEAPHSYKAMILLSLHIVVRAWCHISVYCEMIACAAWPSCYYCQEVSTYCMFSWNSFCLSKLGKVPSHHRENFFLNYKFTQGLLYATQCGILWAEGFELSKCRTFYQQHKKLLNSDKGFDVFFSSVAHYPSDVSFQFVAFCIWRKKNVITGPQTVPKMVRNS